MGYVVNIIKFGFNHEYGLFCGSHRYISPAKQIPVTTINSFQKPKIYKTLNNANRALENLKLKYNINGENLVGVVEEYIDKS